MVDAFERLKHAFCMVFYRTRSLTKENLLHGLAEHLYAAYTVLVEQIDRALTYDHCMRRTDRVLPAGSGEAVVLALFKDIPELRRLIKADMKAAYEGDPAAKNVEEIVFSYPSLEAIVAYRIANRLHRAGVPMIPRIITEHAHSRSGVDINPGATIGARFFIDHGTGVVIGETTVIGKGAVIGGNVWLTKSVAPGSRVRKGPRARGRVAAVRAGRGSRSPAAAV